MQRTSGRGVHLSGWLAAVATASVVAGVLVWALGGTPAGTAASLSGPAPSSAAPSTAPLEPALAPAVRGAPRRLVIEALDVDAPVLSVRTVGDTLVPPGDPQTLGWWADGARPGSARGSILVTGHTVHDGGGALDDLEELERGDRVRVTTRTGRITYVVDTVRTYSKGRIDRDAERLFSQESASRLVLITCEDWDGSRYLANVVVTARPVTR